MQRYIIPDIHGELDKLKVLINRILEVAPTPDKFELIFLGDYVDRGPDSCGVLQYLNFELSRRFKCIFIRGNHDQEFLDYIYSGSQLHNSHPFYNQGFKETVDSYENAKISVAYHMPFLEDLVPYYVFEDANGKHIATHGGWYPMFKVTDISPALFQWDRELLEIAVYENRRKNSKVKIKTADEFDYIYLGHTPVQCYNEVIPQLYGNVWALDTGVGKLPNTTLYALDVNSQELIN